MADQTHSERSAVSARSVTKEYKSGLGVFDIDLDVEEGSILGMIGPSGSGKTTTVRLMTGLLKPDSGEMTVLGQNPLGFDRQTRARIGYMPQHAVLYPSLSLLQNLNFAASLFGMSRSEKADMDSLIDFVELGGVVDRRPTEASGGEKRRLSLASTLVHDPELIFLDEPTVGIDPVLRRKFWDRFSDLSSSGRTLVVTTQYVGEAAYCDKVAVVDQGRIIALETPEGLRQKAYGGEVILATFGPGAEISRIEKEVAGLGLVKDSRRMGTGKLQLTVDEADSAMEQLRLWCERSGVPLENLERFDPPFDDVFVDLLDKFGVEATQDRPDGLDEEVAVRS